jgi:BirA family biotin operon repressor/biotin-[acetyl-CoA-carboxylase] ligase
VAYMKKISLSTPFFAPIYHKETTDSTMSDARLLAARGEPHGTVAIAEVQEAGRGRIPGRLWAAGRGDSLLFTILLRYPLFSAIPQAITLRTGLAVSLAIEDFAPPLRGLVSVKWPNDIMISATKGGLARKAAGILTEGDGKNVFIGVGINVSQETFPEAYRRKAVSITMALGNLPPGPEDRLVLLEKVLAHLYQELGSGETTFAGTVAEDPAPSWRNRLEERLYLRGRPVRFILGGAGSGELVEGVLQGLGPGGELLILPHGAPEARSFVTGELDI